jgi:trehalose 6-phosphate synthase/phosphatase
MAKTIIVSNRLPVKIQTSEEGISYKPSEGGLATGLGSIYKQGGNLWIGWPGMYVDDIQTQDEITATLRDENMSPIFLTTEDIRDFYEGFSNETLWPIFHYFMEYAEYERPLWEAYERVNQKFCEEIIKHAEPGDTLWVHDYQLMMLPQMIRDRLENANIGFFLHIPFPSYEVFRLLPWRKEIITGLLGSDLVGFHTYDDMRHFLSSVERIVGFSNKQGQIQTGKRTLIVDSFPMGIDYDKYANTAQSEETIAKANTFKESIKDSKLIVSIDRLDYSKGIPQRLNAYEMFLERFPEFREKVTLYMVVVPSRDKVEKYKMLKEEVDEMVGRINGKFGRVAWTPIHYFYRSFPLPSLSAFYRLADVALVTPMRDGMNLVCKEYVASKDNNGGVLVLSEMAGASKELSDALIINPNNIEQIVETIYQALTMEPEEQNRRIKSMQSTLKKFNIHHWVNLFMDRLEYIKKEQATLTTRNIDAEMTKQIRDEYQKASNRLIFLDYDGTLIKFDENPDKAKPDSDLRLLLEKLSNDEKNKVVIISGRDKNTLSHWFESFNLDIIGEHGVWLKKNGDDWKTIDDMHSDWKGEILPVLELYVNRTPGSFIEEKDYSLVWHYRKVETGLGKLRTSEISTHLKYLSSNINLQVLEGDHVVEIKSMEINKGKAASLWLQNSSSDFILSIGDDWTDEDTFKVMPKDAFTIRVGSISSAAKYNVEDYKNVRDLLKQIV